MTRCPLCSNWHSRDSSQFCSLKCIYENEKLILLVSSRLEVIRLASKGEKDNE